LVLVLHNISEFNNSLSTCCWTGRVGEREEEGEDYQHTILTVV